MMWMLIITDSTTLRILLTRSFWTTKHDNVFPKKKNYLVQKQLTLGGGCAFFIFIFIFSFWKWPEIYRYIRMGKWEEDSELQRRPLGLTKFREKVCRAWESGTRPIVPVFFVSAGSRKNVTLFSAFEK